MLKIAHEQFSNNLKTVRLIKNISQKQLAETVGVSVSTIRSWEKGQTEPKGKHLIALAEALGVRIQFLSLDFQAIEDSDLM